MATALAWAVFFCPVVAHAQVDGNPDDAVAKDEAAQESTVPSGKTEQKNPQMPKQADEKNAKFVGEAKTPGKQIDASANVKTPSMLLAEAGGLLDLNDGDFLYRRIPDKKFTQAASQAQDAFLADASVNTEETPDASQRKGLFGLSAKTTDYLAKGFLLFIILMIIILYRMRARTRRSTVHKSFR
jgi:hypothetical protein